MSVFFKEEETEFMEGQESDAGLISDEELSTSFHFESGFICEREGENFVRIDVTILHEPGDSVGEDASFTASSACENEAMIVVKVGRCLELTWIERG